MEHVIRLAQENSIAAKTGLNLFVSKYWIYRSYRAELLPELGLNLGVANFNRSLVALQDYHTGTIGYRANYNMMNEATLHVTQNIPWTGGTISLSTQLSRLDQYAPFRQNTYHLQPMYLSYVQTLWGYNHFKWDKESYPLQYEMAKREYIEGMEQIAQTAISYFWGYVAAREIYERTLRDFEESKHQFRVGETRFAMGAITKDQLLQIEVSMLNDSLAVHICTMNYRMARNRLSSYIGYKDEVDFILAPSYEIPNFELSYEDVLTRALTNSSFGQNQKIEYIEAERNVARAKASSGITASLSARLGLSGASNSVETLLLALQDQEVVGISIGLPLVDWGLGRGRIKMAEAQVETTKNRLQQNMVDYRLNIQTQVMQFNGQRLQCEIAQRAASLAEESYQLALQNFGAGKITVMQLEQFKERRDVALTLYINNVADFWNYYFAIRRITLYDWILGRDIGADFDKLIR